MNQMQAEQTDQQIAEGLDKILTGVQCPMCSKSFSNAQGLAMHKVRVHTARGRINHGANAARGKHKKLSEAMKESWRRRTGIAPVKSKAERLERRRQYQRRLRDRYYREGRNSKGEMMPAGWKPRLWSARRNQAKARRAGTGKWDDPQFKRDYQKALYHKKYSKAAKQSQANGVVAPQQEEETKPRMNYALAADAVINAAHVLQAVALGFRITGK